MIIYNVTVKVNNEIHNAWLEWLTKEHIPEVLETGYFNDSKVYKILVEDESDGVSYSIQYFAENMQKYFDYINFHSTALRKKGLDKWGDQFVAFRTVLKAI